MNLSTTSALCPIFATASSSPRWARRHILLVTAFSWLATPVLLAQQPDPIKVFANPPAEARPMVRWWWFGAAVKRPEILRELQQMKADGIGGAELAFVYPQVLDDPAKGLKNLPFLSKEMLDDVNYAQAEGRKLGLRIDVTLCSGWPYGGPATTLAEAATQLRVVQLPVPPNTSEMPQAKLGEGESLISVALVDGMPDAPMRRGAPADPAPNSWDATSAKTFGGTLMASDKARVALYFIQSHTRQQVKRAAVGAEGFVLDPFSKEAVATHLKSVGEPLVTAFGATPPYAIFSDSLEAYGADWTPALPAEFKRRRGYDLVSHLPELLAGGSPAADNVRHDYGVTLTELVNENYLMQIDAWAKAHGTKFRSQTYGEPAVSFSSQNLVDLAEGEGPQWRAFSTLRWASSANHVFGHNVTSGETFTWLHSPVFRATPLDMKAEADIDFLMGENQLIYHGWPYSPPAGKVPEPGWSLYAAASFNDHNPWHPVMPAVDAYIARVSALLRMGEPANQVAILLPTDDAWASFAPGRVSVTNAMQKLISPALMSAILSAGYNVDYIDAEAIEKVGIKYPVLVVPPTKRMPQATMDKLDAYRTSGGNVIWLGSFPLMPQRNERKTPQQIYADLLNMNLPLKDEKAVAKALLSSVPPDLVLLNADDSTRNAIGFIRRKLPNADIYFVANTTNETIDTTATFGTTFKRGVAIDPDSTVANAATALSQQVKLAPYESRVFIFSDTEQGAQIAPTTATKSFEKDLSADWMVSFSGLHKSVKEATLTDWAAAVTTKNYSGEAVYVRDFKLDSKPASPVYLKIDGGDALPGAPNSPPEHVVDSNGLSNPLITRTGPGMHAYFDPPIHEAALVFINGQAAGALWHPPYRLDVSKLLRPGQNHIEIRVYNTALNAWAALPPHDYKPLIEKYGDRFQMQDLNQVKPIASGILGKIELTTEGPQ